MPVADVVARLETKADGLTDAQADERRRRFGLNVLRVHRVTPLGILRRQVQNPLLILLVGAATVSAATGGSTDAAIIGVIVLLSVSLGFVNELRAANAVAALHGSIHHTSVTWRGGAPRTLPSDQLVAGDVIDLQMGDIVPADARLLQVNGLECDESVLTGESMPVDKAVALGQPPTSRVDLPTCVFMGTIIQQGTGRAVVVATGTRTEFGHISAGLTEHQADTAFQTGLRGFSAMLVRVAAVLTSGIFLINVVLARPLIDALLFSLAIAIGITPQLLPAIVSVSLSAGSRSLARKRVLVKRLVTIEDLGNVGVLFTDKTGTLTDGHITFHRTIDAEGRSTVDVLRLGLLCNEATLTDRGAVGGNALDMAVMDAPDARPLLGEVESTHRVGSLPFDHRRQLASVIVDTPNGRVLITKGAPEVVLERCVNLPANADAVVQRLFADGERVIAIASRPAPDLSTPADTDEQALQLQGFLTFVDRPKDGVADAVAELAGLGVTIKVITGDNPIVAGKVCHDIGIPVTGMMTGAQMRALDDDALAAAIPDTTIFARVDPEQKSRLVKLARRTGKDVAFLGDGVNDAVALHSADVGISVDSATEVAKDAADIVLLDRDLRVLADGIREGRGIFTNTLKYVLMATSSNFGNMFSAAGASVFLSFLPMLPSQILLNNLLYDAGQLAIPTDRVDPEIVAHPAAWDVRFVRRFMFTFGPLSSIFDVLTFVVMLVFLHASHGEFRTGWFVESLATQTLVIFVIRTRRVPFTRARPSLAMLLVPTTAAAIGAVLPFTPLAHPLGFTALPLSFFLILVAMIVTYLLLVESVKARFYRVQDHPHRTPRTHDQRRHHLIRRRASVFVHHHPSRLRLPGA